MGEFGEVTVLQTTLASMFPISYEFLISSGIMSKRTPQPFAPLAPEKVRPLITTPFSLTYSGLVKMSDLNTELLFLARAISAPTQSVAGGIGVVPGEALLIDISFVDVTVDDVAVPLVIQGLTMTGTLTFSGNLTSFGIVHIGYCNISGSLTFSDEITVASLELYSCVVGAEITLPPGPSLTSLLIYGQYPQISFADLQNTKTYPVLSSLMYLNGVDGKGSRDIPPNARGFGAFSLSGLTKSSYPNITTLATTDPWSVDLETLFPHLVSLFVIEYSKGGAVTVPETPKSKYSLLTFIGAQEITSLDITKRADFLTAGIRIVGCPRLTTVMLRPTATTSEPPREYRILVVERCALLYLRGIKGLNRPITTLRLGDHVSPTITISASAIVGSTRLLDYILAGAPQVGESAAVAADYLPNVIVALAEIMPTLIQYPVMQTVEYQFLRSGAYTQYSGGANPVVPTNGSASLIGAAITVSPFGIRYSLKIVPSSNLSSIRDTIVGLDSTSSASTSKTNFLGMIHHSGRTRVLIIAAAVIGIVVILITVGILIARRASKTVVSAPLKSREPALKK